MQFIVCVDEFCQLLCVVLVVLEQVVVLVSFFDLVMVVEIWWVVVMDYMVLVIFLLMLVGLCQVFFGSWLVVFELQLVWLEQQVVSDIVDFFFYICEGVLLGLYQCLLFCECYVLVGWVEYLVLWSGFSLEMFCQLEYVIVFLDGGGFSVVIDIVLVNFGLMWWVVFFVLYFLFMLEILCNSDLVVVLLEWLVCGQSGLVVVELLLVVVGFEMLMLWYECWYCDLVY